MSLSVAFELASGVAWAGPRLDEVREEVNAPGPRTQPTPTDDEPAPFGPPNDDEFETNPIDAVELLAEVPPPTFSYARFPYADGAAGYHLAEVGDWGGPSKRAAGAVSIEGGYLYGSLGRTSLNLLLLGGQRFGMGFRYDGLLEGNLDGSIDHLHALTINAGYQLVTERVAVRFSPALQLLNDPKNLDNGGWIPGGGLSIETDIYPLPSLAVSGRVHLGALGGAFAYEGRATVGVLVRRVELYAGYDHRGIGRALLGGPTMGLKVRF